MGEYGLCPFYRRAKMWYTVKVNPNLPKITETVPAGTTLIMKITPLGGLQGAGGTSQPIRKFVCF